MYQGFLLFGVITQIVVFGLYTLNNYFYPKYIVDKSILKINVIITFAFSLIVLKVLDEVINLYKNKEKIDRKLKVLILFTALIFLAYIFIEADYSFELIIYIVLMYFAKKLYLENIISQNKYYIFLTISTLLFIAIYMNTFEAFAVLSLPFMFMYNGEKGKKSKIITIIFYAFYPLQHFLLYFLAMLILK